MYYHYNTGNDITMKSCEQGLITKKCTMHAFKFKGFNLMPNFTEVESCFMLKLLL